MGVAAGQTTSFPASGSGSRVLLSRYNASGNALINRVYPNLPGQTPSCKAIDTKPVASGGGLAAGVYVLGNVQKPTATGLIVPGLFITRLNALGVVLWHREYIPPANQQLTAEAVSLEVMNDLGPIIVANVTSTGSGAQAILAARFTPTGTTMWTQRYRAFL